jgi:hypothetical protein
LDESKVHDLLDDFESVAWVLREGAKRFCCKGGFKNPVAMSLLTYPGSEDSSGFYDASELSGQQKRRILLSDDALIPSPDIRSRPLAQLVADVLQCWRSYYDTDRMSDEEAHEHRARLRGLYEDADWWLAMLDAALARDDLVCKESCSSSNGAKQRAAQAPNDISLEEPQPAALGGVLASIDADAWKKKRKTVDVAHEKSEMAAEQSMRSPKRLCAR